MNAFSRMGAMLTDFIQAIPPSAAPPPIVNFPIQVGAPPPAAPAIEQSLPTAPQRALTLFLSSAPSTSGRVPASPTKDKKKQNKKKKKKRGSSSASDTDVGIY
jgi:hypothetical protein